MLRQTQALQSFHAPADRCGEGALELVLIYLREATLEQSIDLSGYIAQDTPSRSRYADVNLDSVDMTEAGRRKAMEVLW